MKKLFLTSLFFILIVIINAVSVSISISNYRSYSGVLQALYCMNAGLRPNATPNPNTTNCRAGIGNGQSSLNSGQQAYIFSPQFTQSYTIPSGASIAVEIWAARSSGQPGRFSVSVAVVDSSGKVVQTIASNIQSTTYSGKTIQEWHTTITTSSTINILSGYYIRVSLSTVTNTNFNIYWGNSANQEPTNFQLPLVTLTA